MDKLSEAKNHFRGTCFGSTLGFLLGFGICKAKFILHCYVEMILEYNDLLWIIVMEESTELPRKSQDES